MKNIDLYAVILLVIFSSCSNNLDILDPIDPIPVVYFQMNPADSVFYLTLTKTFSGDGNAFDLARDADRVFYDSADIRLEGWTNQYKVLETRFEPSDRSKNSGIFPGVPGYCFESANEFSNFLGQITSFRLVINLPGIPSPVFSRIPAMSLPVVPSRYNHEIALYPNGYEFPRSGGAYRQLVCEFHYQEYEGTWVDHSVTFTLRKDITNETKFIYADMFFNRLVRSISPINDTILRKFISLDLICLAADQYFKDYMDTYTNAGNLDLPLKGNINNGYGLFTLMTSAKYKNMNLDQRSFDSLCNGKITGKLGFVEWR